MKKVIGLHKDRLKYAPHAPQWGARVAPTKRGTREREREVLNESADQSTIFENVIDFYFVVVPGTVLSYVIVY